MDRIAVALCCSTLLNTETIIAGAFNDAARSLATNRALPRWAPRLSNALCGTGLDCRAQALAGHVDTDEFVIQGMLLVRIDAYLQLDCVKPMHGVHELLTKLDARGMPVAIVSNLPTQVIKTAVRQANLTVLATAVVGVDVDDDTHKPMPAPDLFERAAADLGVKPRRLVALVDTQPAVDAANAAGALTYCLHRPDAPTTAVHQFNSLETLDLATMDAVVRSR